MPVNPIHTDRTVQHVDVRIYFPVELDREELLDKISETLQGDAYNLCEMVSAYELINDGFAHLLPGDKPLA